MIELRKTTSTNAEEEVKRQEERQKDKQLNRSASKGKYRAENNAVRKVIMLGDAGVGKTSIVQRVLTNQFTRNVEPTIGNNTFDYNLQVKSTGKNMTFRIWDISGQDQYMSLTTMYYRDIDAVIIVYDITDTKSFQNLKKWFRQLRENAPESISIALCGNKYDLKEQQQVPFNDGQKFSLQQRCSIFKEVSALNATNLFEVLQKLADELSQRPTNVDARYISGSMTKRLTAEKAVEEREKSKPRDPYSVTEPNDGKKKRDCCVIF